MKQFKKVLVANRGEIAIRVFRALNELGIVTVSIYSKEDRYALFRSKADESYPLNPDKGPIDAYLDIDTIIKIALNAGVDAIHPGYGFLSENPEFVDACEQNGITFIGPSSDIMRAMGDKISSKQIAIAADVPIIPGVDHAMKSYEEAAKIADMVGYPIMLKASNGGGGRGMRIVNDPADLEKEFNEARNESKKAFGDDMIFVEKYLKGPKHIEVQVIGDNYGNVVHLYDRDCSVQRRHQKLIEEAPSPALTEDLRRAMGVAAIKAVRAVNYKNAGTIEFLLDERGSFYFMEMNTRVQVEHSVTEMVTGTDLVEEMIRVAAGDPLTFTQDDITYRGHAIECRVNAEQPERGFLPSPGTISQMHLPGGNGVRVDTAAFDGYEISPYYDSMISKIIVHGRDRTEAIAKMRTALEEMVVVGVKTNLDFQYAIMENETFAAGAADTSFIDRFMKGEV